MLSATQSGGTAGLSAAAWRVYSFLGNYMCTWTPCQSIHWKLKVRDCSCQKWTKKHNQSANVKDQRGVITHFFHKQKRMLPGMQGNWVFKFALSLKLSRGFLYFWSLQCRCLRPSLYKSIIKNKATNNRRDFCAHFLSLLPVTLLGRFFLPSKALAILNLVLFSFSKQVLQSSVPDSFLGSTQKITHSVSILHHTAFENCSLLAQRVRLFREVLPWDIPQMSAPSHVK